MHKKLATLALLAISVPAVADDQFSLGTGFDYSTGKYGNATATDILYVPVVGKYESDNLTLKLTVPYISVSGPGGVVMGIGRVGAPVSIGLPINGRTTTTSTTSATSTNSGLGDVIASAGYTVYSAAALTLDVVGNVKLGTADASKGLGTGQNDYYGQVDGYYLLGQTTLFGTAGYRYYGSPAGVSLSSAPYGTVGASQKLSDDTSAGLMLDVTKSPSIYSADQVDATVFVSQKISTNLKVQANLLKGFANGSPDFGGGVMVTGTF